MSLPDAFSATEVTLRGNGRWVRLEDYARTVGGLRAQLEAAEAEVAQRTRAANSWMQACDEQVDRWREMRARAEATEAECARLLEDAERYRWLRDQAPYQWGLRVWVGPAGQVVYFGKGIEEAIDAARTKEQQA